MTAVEGRRAGCRPLSPPWRSSSCLGSGVPSKLSKLGALPPRHASWIFHSSHLYGPRSDGVLDRSQRRRACLNRQPSKLCFGSVLPTALAKQLLPWIGCAKQA